MEELGRPLQWLVCLLHCNELPFRKYLSVVEGGNTSGPSSATGSGPSSATGSGPSSATGSGPSSATGSRPSSATGSGPSSATGSEPSSVTGSISSALDYDPKDLPIADFLPIHGKVTDVPELVQKDLSTDQLLYESMFSSSDWISCKFRYSISSKKST